MKNGYFELGYLLLIVGFGTFDWIERSRERMEAVATATHLRAFLTERLGSEAKDFQALSDIGDIEHFIQWESGGVYVVVYTILGHVDKWRIQRRIDVMSMKPRKLSAVLS